MQWEYVGIGTHVLDGEESAEDFLFMLKTDGEETVIMKGTKECE